MSESIDTYAKLILGMDNRSAITGMKEVADQSDVMKDSIRADGDEESASMDRVAEHTGMLKDSLSAMWGMVGIAGVGFGLKDLVDDGMKLQEQQGQLQQALKDTGQQATAAGQGLEKMAEAMSTRGGFSTTENLGALTQFVRETKSASEAQTMLSDATNLARGANISLSDAQSEVAKAYNGQGRALQSQIGLIVQSKEAQEGLTMAHDHELASIAQTASFMSGPAKVAYEQQAALQDHLTLGEQQLVQLQDKHATGLQELADIQKVYGDSTAKFNSSTQGQMSDLDNSFHNLTEQMGLSLMPAFKMFVGIGESVAKTLEHCKTEVVVFAGLVGAGGMLWGGVKVFKAMHDTVSELKKGIQAAGGWVQDLAQKIGLTGSVSEAAAGEQNMANASVAMSTREVNMLLDQNALLLGETRLMTMDLAAEDEALTASMIAAGDAGLIAGTEMAGGAEAATVGWDTFMSSTIIGLVLVGLMLLIENWKAVEKAAVAAWHWIETAAQNTWDWIKSHWVLIATILAGPVGFAAAEIITHFHDIEKFVVGVWHDIEHAASTVWHDIVGIVKSAVHDIKDVMHDLGFGGNGVMSYLNPVGLAGHALGALGLNQGGPVYRDMGGGMFGSMGTDTIPTMLSPGEGVLSVQGMDALSRLNTGQTPAGLGTQQVRVEPANVTMQVDGQVLGTAVLKWASNQAARGASSLVGGSIAISGAGGTVGTLQGARSGG